MNKYQNWNFGELKASIKARFGREHAERAWLSIQSVAQRLEHVAYHQSELIICSKMGDSISKPELLLSMLARENKDLNEMVLRFSAHTIAGVQALHAVTDILGSAIRLSLHNDLQWKGNLKEAVNTESSSLKLLVVELQGHEDYLYLNAVVNQSKHRNIVRAPFLMSMSNNTSPRFEFEMFERNAKSYPEREVLSFLSAERIRHHDVISRIGNELNALAKKAISV